ncbi:hypothetical protein DL96DRAFT_1822465 [Flagelloscypha sp. PMI_526]|nr:hypothetical protein DL96DRAFT_1822465 [Flagelloscypha sp. PMI_526]
MSLPISEDVLAEIVHFVHDIDRQTIFSLNVVNSAFHSTALSFVYRECSFDLTTGVKPEDLQRLQMWLDLKGHLSWVPNTIRRFTVRTKRYPPFFCRLNTWDPFLDLIPRMKSLSTFMFSIRDAQFPIALLQALELNIPQVCLVIHKWNAGWLTGGDEAKNHLEAPFRSPLLREVHAVNRPNPDDVTFVALRHFVSLAPKLEKVVICAPPPNEHGRWIRGNHRYNQSERISRAEAWFGLAENGKHKQVQREFRHLELTHSPADFAEHCLRIVNPTHLERLDLELPIATNPAIINHLTFPALRHLALDVYDESCIASLLRFSKYNVWESLSKTILPQFLDSHGPTLKTLILRNDLDDTLSPKRVIPFSPIRQESICLIRDACPLLERLAICVSRKCEIAVFAILAKFSYSLRHLTVDFGSGCSFIHIPASVESAGCFHLKEGVDIAMQLKLPSDDIEKWEQMLWLQVPLSNSDVEAMFGKIYMGGNGASSLETLVVRIRHPWASFSQQEFVVQRQFGGNGLTTTIAGYRIPEGKERVLEFNNMVSREERLKMMWTKFCPVTPFPLEKR